MEKILSILEGTFKKAPDDGYTTYIGYEVTTDKQNIVVGIEDGQCCCEQFGYLTTNDDLSEFIGADLVSIAVVDTAMNNKKFEELEGLDYGGGAMFVNFETTNGLFQLVAYNSHNGYYGHEAVVISHQLKHAEVL